jgi:serine protease Do
MSTGYDNNNNSPNNMPQPGGRGGWSPYQGDQSRQEFFQRYSSVFQEPSGSYQGSYSTPNPPPPSYQPQPPVKEKKHRSGKGVGAGLIAACLVVSVVGGAAGSWGMSYLSRQEGTVFYQAVGSTEKENENGEQSPADGVQAGYTGGVLSVSEIAALASPSVVEISTETVSRSNFLGQYIQSGAGSGVIFSEDGIVVTNDHVVDGASTITVRTKDGESYEATLLGTDSKTDIAVLRIEADGLTPAILGDSDALSVGEYAMAIGNPLGQLGGTVTDGIVSALSREVNVNGENMTLLQTNAAINPGNSGGGLFNEKGELIGIVNAKSSNGASSSGASIEGLGFAIPVNTVKNSVQELLDYGYVRGRPALGITLLNVQNAQDAFQYRVSRLGVYVQSVTEGGASEKAGVQVGDCIIALGDVAVSTHAEVKSQLNNYAVGDTVQLQVIRDGRTLTLDVTLEEFKPDAES